MKQSSVLLIFFFIHSYIYSQYINTSCSDAQEIKKRILLVALQEEDKHFLSQFGEETPAKANIYKNDIEGQRLAFKSAIEKHWKFNDSIVILSLREAKSLAKQSPGKYAIMKVGEQYQDQTFVKGYTPISQVTGWKKSKDGLTYNYSNRNFIGMLGITTLIIETPKRVIEVYLPKVSPSEGDFIYGLNQMGYILSTLLKTEGSSAKKIYKETSKLSEQLKSKVLLLDRNELKCSAEEVKKSYPYPFRIVDYKEIEKALKAKDSNYVFIQGSRYDYDNSTYYLSDTSDGTIYCHFTDITFKYGNVNANYMSVQVFYPAITCEKLEKCGSNK